MEKAAFRVGALRALAGWSIRLAAGHRPASRTAGSARVTARIALSRRVAPDGQS